MLKKTITFKDFDGNDLTEDFYFNISKAELTEFEASQKGGLSEHLKKIVEDEDGKQIMATFREIIRMSVGMRSEDGRRFIKSEEITNDFMQTGAYDVLFMELVTSAEAGSAFIKGIVPSDLAESLKTTDVNLPIDATDEAVPAWLREHRFPTDAELRAMSKDEMAAAFRFREQMQRESQ